MAVPYQPTARAALAKQGRAVRQKPVNYNGNGVAPVQQPQPQKNPLMAPRPPVLAPPGQPQPVGNVGMAANQARMQGMAPKIAPPQFMASPQGQPQRGQVQSQVQAPNPHRLQPGEQVVGPHPLQPGEQVNGPHPLQPGEKTPTVQDNVNNALNNVPGGQDLSKLFGGGYDMISNLLKFLGIDMGGGGGGGQGGAAAPGAGATRTPTYGPSGAGGHGTGATAQPGINDGTGVTGGSRGAGVVTSPALRQYQPGAQAQPAGVQPGMATPQPAQSIGGPQAAAGQALPTSGFSKQAPPQPVQGAQQGQQAADTSGRQMGSTNASVRSDGGWSQDQDQGWSSPYQGLRGSAANAGNGPPSQDPLSNLANQMTTQDMARYTSTFNPFNTTNAQANDALGAQVNDLMDPALLNGGTQAMQDSLHTATDAQRNEQLRMAEARGARGGVMSPGSTSSILGNATNAIAQGNRDITAGAFDRDMQRQGMLGNARNNLASSLTQGNMSDQQNLQDQYTSNKELFDQLLGFAGEAAPF